MNANTNQIFFALIRSAIHGDQIGGTERAALSGEVLQSVLALSEKHDLAHLVGYALSSNAIAEQEQAQQLQMTQIKALYRYEQLRHALEELCGVLEDAQIPFMPLKGSVIRELYPEPWLRTSCDIDILVHEEDLDRAVAHLTAVGWSVRGNKNYHDISLYSPTGVHLELHFNIKENIDRIDAVLERVWEYSAPIDGKRYEYRQTNEFLLFHFFAHMSYHFVAGGCGVRPLLDISILQDRLTYDESAFAALCAAAGLTRFCACVAELIHVWFEGAAPTPLTAKMEAYIMSGGVYGIGANHVAVQRARRGGRLRYLCSRLFVPYRILKTRYPVLEKHKWLYPFMQVRRWFEALFGGRAKDVSRELKINQGISPEQVNEISLLLSEVGL